MNENDNTLFAVTIFPSIAVRVYVEATTRLEAMDRAAEQVDFDVWAQRPLSGAAWAQFADGYETCEVIEAEQGPDGPQVSDEGISQWFKGDLETPLPAIQLQTSLDQVIAQARANLRAKGLAILDSRLGASDIAASLGRAIADYLAAMEAGWETYDDEYLSALATAEAMFEALAAGTSSLPDEQAALKSLWQCPDLPDDFHWANRDAVEAFEQAFRQWCAVRDAVLQVMGSLEPCQPGRHLIIEGVDMELLEVQRLCLGKAMVRAGSRGLHLTPDEALALTGVVYMLDAWSDERRAKESVGRA